MRQAGDRQVVKGSQANEMDQDALVNQPVTNATIIPISNVLNRLASHFDSLNNQLTEVEKSQQKKSVSTPRLPRAPSKSLNAILEQVTSLNSKLKAVDRRLEDVSLAQKTLQAALNPVPPSLTNSTFPYSQNITIAGAMASSRLPLPPHLSSQRLPSIDPLRCSASINKSKPGQFDIQAPKVAKAFTEQRECVITKKKDVALSQIETKCDGSQVNSKGPAGFRSGGVKIFTSNRRVASWLLDNKHHWKKVEDPASISSPTRYPVILHFCPTQSHGSDRKLFGLDSDFYTSQLCTENGIPRDVVHDVKWLGRPFEEGRKNGSLIISFLDKETAARVGRSGLLFDGCFLKGSPFKTGPSNSYDSLEMGSSAHLCKNKPLSSSYSGKHDTMGHGINENVKACHQHLVHQKQYNLDTGVDSLEEYSHRSPFNNQRLINL